jgi:hypothetical protein
VQGIEYAIPRSPKFPCPSYDRIVDADCLGCKFKEAYDIQPPFGPRVPIRLFNEGFA